MQADIGAKEEKLAAILAEMGGAVVAFSGGVDSTCLLAMAKAVLGEKVVAVTAVSELQPVREREGALETARRLSVRHVRMPFDILADPDFCANSNARCYICKKALFERMLTDAAPGGEGLVCHGANCDDLADFRPGNRAAVEQGIRAPLVEAGLTKADVRLLSRKLGLDTWNRPAMACLASRIPCGTPITRERLHMVEAAEEVLHRRGLTGCRVRYHGEVARIETREEDFTAILAPAVRQAVAGELKKVGFRFISLDLEGYRQGSLNPSGEAT